MRRRSGFTLLELLIVIAIIGILVAIGTASYASAQKRARDTRRQGDMKAIQNAFEQFYSQNGTYPSSCSISSDFLLGGIPSDPLGQAYFQSCNVSSYCFCAGLDLPGKGNATNKHCNFGSGNFFCVRNLQ